MNINKLKTTEWTWPKKHCVYFLTNKKGEILYVGKTNKLYYRIGEHSYRKQFDRVFFIEYSSEKEMAEKEMEYILLVQPKYNTRIDNPKLFGLISISELMMLGRKRGIKLKQVKKLMIEKNVRTVQFKNIYYFDKSALNYL
jgi:excinuclease UvrABC nuclease subunit